jgi:tetratricopeptide (TPR) repeat protein
MGRNETSSRGVNQPMKGLIEGSCRLARFRDRLGAPDKPQHNGFWETADLWWGRVLKAVGGAGALLAFAIIVWLFYDVLFERSIAIRPISVPKLLQERGYTSDVAAIHLRDALNAYAANARTSALGPQLALNSDLPDFVLPTVGLSFEAVAARLRTFFRIDRRRNISGELTLVDQELHLRLRKNTGVIYESVTAHNPDQPDTLFTDAAPAVFAATEPYFNAVAKSAAEPEVALKITREIIADWPPTDPNVVWAHNLLGLIQYHKRRLDDNAGALAEFKWAILHAPRFAPAHINLGIMYREQGRLEAAISEFRSAVRIDPESPIAHINLAKALREAGENEEAACEYREAITERHNAVVSAPRSATAHLSLGSVLKNVTKASHAACGYAAAMDALGKVVASFVGLATDDGDISGTLEDDSKYGDSAINEYRHAVALAPGDARMHYNLGAELYDSGRAVDEAIIEFRKAIDLDPHFYDALAGLSYALRSKARRSEAVGDYLSGDSEYAESAHLFERAMAETEAEIRADSRNASAHRTNGIHLYYMGKFAEATAEHDRAVEIDNTYLTNLTRRGYARFALADYDKAAEDFARALPLPEDQAYTMIWLYLSRQHARVSLGAGYYQKTPNAPIPFMELLGNAAKLKASNRYDNLNQLERQRKQKQLSAREEKEIMSRQEWPIPVIELFLDHRSPTEVLTDAKDSNSKCEAYFYIGEWLVLRGKTEDAVKSFEQARDSCRFDYIELQGAKAELKRLGR